MMVFAALKTKTPQFIMAARKPVLPLELMMMLELPALIAPPGVKYNFVNPPNLRTEFYIDLILCLTISSLAVSMRVWTKARLIKKFGREDCKGNFSFFFLPLPCPKVFLLSFERLIEFA